RRHPEGCLSGLKGRSRKPVYRFAVPWVRIPPPPLRNPEATTSVGPPWGAVVGVELEDRQQFHSGDPELPAEVDAAVHGGGAQGRGSAAVLGDHHDDLGLLCRPCPDP